MTLERIGVVGCGAMGAGIAQLALQAGYDVAVSEADEALLASGLARVRGGLERLVKKGSLSAGEADAMVGRLSGSASFDHFAVCDLVIEAIFEDLEAKIAVFGRLDGICKKEAVFATNTSSLSVSAMAASTSRPARLVGMHFFNPPVVMPLVEIIRTVATDPEVLEAAFEAGRSFGKVPILAKDNAGFIVNLLLTPYLMDAMRAASEGVASVADIDTGMKLGCNYPMGPLMLADFIGLDVLVKGAATLFQEYADRRYAPPPVLKRLVAMGWLGMKSGRGFYDWSDPKNPVPAKLDL